MTLCEGWPVDENTDLALVQALTVTVYSLHDSTLCPRVHDAALMRNLPRWPIGIMRKSLLFLDLSI